MKVFKKSLAVLLAVMMLFSVMAIAVSAADETPDAGTTWIIAGTANLCGGDGWDPTDTSNALTKGEDGIFTKTYTGLAEGTYEFKVTNGSWDEAYGDGANNIVFIVSATTDVTIKFNAETKEVTFEGENASAPATLEIASITAVGTGKNGFLKDIEWKQDAAENHMEGKDGVYTITYNDVLPGSYEVKFAANDAWTDSWGVKKADDTNEYPVNAAVYNGDNIPVVVDAVSNITLTFDASKFDYSTKLGATYDIKIEPTGATVAPTEPGEAPTVVAGYYLTGSEALFGTEWKNAADENTLLTKAADGSYYRDFKNIPAGEYACKAIYVNANGDVFWHPAGMGNDAKIVVDKDNATVRLIFIPNELCPPESSIESPETVIAEIYGPDEVPPVKEPYVEPTDPSVKPTDPVKPTEPAKPTVTKKTNKMKVTVASVKKLTTKANKKVKGKKVTKKAVTFKKAIKVTKNKGGKVSYSVVKKGSNTKQLSVNKKGYVTVKKGTKKGTYKIKVKVTAKATSKYKSASKTVTVKVKVK